MAESIQLIDFPATRPAVGVAGFAAGGASLWVDDAFAAVLPVAPGERLGPWLARLPAGPGEGIAVGRLLCQEGQWRIDPAFEPQRPRH